MRIKKLNSHEVVIHDNRERDLIIVSPAVLENKFEPLKRYLRAIGAIGSDIALAFIFLTPLLTSVKFQDFGPIRGATIEGAFYVGSIVMFIRVCFDPIFLYQRSPFCQHVR